MSAANRPLRQRRPDDNPPGLESRSHLRAIRAALEDHSLWIQAVDGPTPAHEYGYTIGLQDIGHPELIVTGMTCPDVCDVLGHIAHMILEHGVRLRHGELLDLRVPIAGVVAVAQPSWWLAVARDLTSRSVEALQIVLSDDDLLLPGEDGYDDSLPQPILGNPPWTVPGWQRPEPRRIDLP